MTIESPGRAPETKPRPEDLIREARRRQRRRQAVIVLVVAALVGSAAWAVMALGGRRSGGAGPPSRSRTSVPARPKAARPVPLIPGVGTSLLMWPVGPASFTSGGGPPAYFADLGTGRIRQSAQPGISAGDFQPLLARVGRRLVYVGEGTTAIADDLRGRPRALAATPFFAPAAQAGRVWEFQVTGSLGSHHRVRAWTVSAAGDGRSRTVTLPAGAYLPALRGTDAGLLIQTGPGLALWNPGTAPRLLPYAPNISDGFDATARLVAYGTDCTSRVTNAKQSRQPNAGYYACRMLRVLDVVTGRMISFPAPPGTVGWVPNGFDLVSAVSPRSTMMAAYAAVRPPGSGRVRLYTIRLRGAGSRPRPVPSSTAFLFARTAWSVRGGWLLYQGPGGHLSAYQQSPGKQRNSTIPCCRYTVMESVPSGGRAAG